MASSFATFASLDTEFGSILRRVFARLEAQGWMPTIVPGTGGWRDLGTQLQLLAKGVSGVSFSFHNAVDASGKPAALAADVIDRRYGWSGSSAQGFFRALGEAAKAEGLSWGGDWSSLKDYSHVQRYPNAMLGTIRKQSEAVWAAIKSGNLAVLPGLAIHGYVEVLKSVPWWLWALYGVAGFTMIVLVARSARRARRRRALAVLSSE